MTDGGTQSKRVPERVGVAHRRREHTVVPKNCFPTEDASGGAPAGVREYQPVPARELPLQLSPVKL